jgi:hypothetical protein
MFRSHFSPIFIVTGLGKKVIVLMAFAAVENNKKVSAKTINNLFFISPAPLFKRLMVYNEGIGTSWRLRLAPFGILSPSLSLKD